MHNAAYRTLFTSRALAGGAFGNDDRWIDAAMRRAIEMMSGFALDVRLVSYGTPSRAVLQMVGEFCLNGIGSCMSVTVVSFDCW
jgi:hypothetical protein